MRKIYWGRGLVALIAVGVGVAMGLLMERPGQDPNEIPPAVERRYRFNEALQSWRDRLSRAVQEVVNRQQTKE